VKAELLSLLIEEQARPRPVDVDWLIGVELLPQTRAIR
jgi:hypothetical protein